MNSQSKIDANRRNAQRSTGPKTPSGKAIASMNAVKHGLLSRAPIVPGERECDFHAYAERWVEQLKPVGPIEEFLVERIITASWRLRRVAQMEAGLFQPTESEDPARLAQLSRYEVALERSFYRNMKELERLQAARAEQEEAADRADSEELPNEATGVEVPPAVLLTEPQPTVRGSSQ